MAKQSNTAPRNDTLLPESAWPADNVERWPLERLIPYARNARTHSDAQVAQIAASIREWGWTSAVLVDEDGGIIAGHGRVLAARQLGIVSVPVTVASGWSEAQRRAYVIADNKLALNAGWDDDLLKLELAELNASGFAMDTIGFQPDDLNAILAGWDSEFDPIAKDGENLDGISSMVRVSVAQDIRDQAEAVITAALDEAGLAYELR